MPGPAEAVLVVLLIGYVLMRQFTAQPVSSGARWWLVPAVLTYLALSRPGLIDTRHEPQSVGLLVAEFVIGTVTGIGWACTNRLWTDESGTVWAKGTKRTLVVWVAGIALRVGLYAVAGALGVRSGTGSVLVAVAVTLLARSGVLVWRAHALRQGVYRVPVVG